MSEARGRLGGPVKGTFPVLLRVDQVRFRQEFVGGHYDRVEGRPRRFIERQSGVMVDCLVTGRYPGSGKPGPLAFPDPAEAHAHDDHRIAMALAIAALGAHGPSTIDGSEAVAISYPGFFETLGRLVA